MKITQKRSSSVVEGMLVKFGTSNIVEPYDGTGEPAGIAQNCRVVQIQNDPDQPAESVDVCELVIEGFCNVLIDSAASSQGADFGASTTAGSLTVGSTPVLGHVLPQPWSDTTDRIAGLMPALIHMVG